MLLAEEPVEVGSLVILTTTRQKPIRRITGGKGLVLYPDAFLVGIVSRRLDNQIEILTTEGMVEIDIYWETELREVLIYPFTEARGAWIEEFCEFDQPGGVYRIKNPMVSVRDFGAVGLMNSNGKERR